MKNKKIIAKFLISLFLIIGISTLSFSKKQKLDAESETFYNYARYFFTKSERKLFLNLQNKEDRKRFIDHFWEIRDPDHTTEENEFKFAIESRFDYVSKYFREGPVKGWKTDRGRIYLLMGPPDEKDQDYNIRGSNSNNFITSLIRWYYADSNIFVQFIEKRNSNSYRLDLTSATLSLLDELKRKKYFIHKKGTNSKTVSLDFSLSLDKSNPKKLILSMKPENIFFKKEGSELNAKLKIDITIYSGKTDFIKHRKIELIQIDEKVVLKKKSRINIILPFSLPFGKINVDILITDLFGNGVERKFFSFKNKK